MTFPRRSFFTAGLGGLLGYAFAHRVNPLFADKVPDGASAKRCLVLWMDGGPSQIETFDPKPGAATGGPFQSVDTAVPGVQIGEHLPAVAKRMDRLSVIRSVTSDNGAHGSANYLLHTGFSREGGFLRPAAGAVLSQEAGQAAFPNYVTVGAQAFGPAYMGARHAPFSINDAAYALGLFRKIERRKERLRFMRELGREFEKEHNGQRLSRRQAVVEKITELVDTPFMRALDVGAEPAANQSRYGRGDFANRCLLARRLLEAGVTTVEVGLTGWDTHTNNFNRTKALCRTLDQPWAALLDDLQASGLLDETVVLWLGEFGRTPEINGSQGRDHYPLVSNVVLGGGGIPGGRVIGESDATGKRILRDPVPIPDLFATLFSVFGMEPDQEFTNAFGAPAEVTNHGTVLKDLVSL